MNIRILAIVLLIPFTALTIYTVMDVGYIGIFTYLLPSPAGWQVGIDLVIGMILILCWLVPNARNKGRNPWPWVLITLCLGSIGPLSYLAFSPVSAATQ